MVCPDGRSAHCFGHAELARGTTTDAALAVLCAGRVQEATGSGLEGGAVGDRLALARCMWN